MSNEISLGNLSQTLQAGMQQQGLDFGPKSSALKIIAGTAALALFIIGCVGTAGAFPGSTIGWVTVGLAGGGFALHLAMGNLKTRKIDLIAEGLQASIMIIIGSLGGTGILSATQVGWGIVGTYLASIPMNSIVLYIKLKKILSEGGVY